MKTKWVVFLITVLLAFAASSNAWASRDPLGGGTWIVRDPSPDFDEFLRLELSTPGELIVGPNLYKYAINNPIRYTDPLGLQAVDSVTEGLMQGIAQNNSELIDVILNNTPETMGRADIRAAARALSEKLKSSCGSLVRGSLKRAPGYPSQLENETYEQLLKDNSDPAKIMKKLIDQSKRLMDKNKG